MHHVLRLHQTLPRTRENDEARPVDGCFAAIKYVVQRAKGA